VAKKQECPPKESKFSKQQLISSKKYANQRDIVNVLLEEGKQYGFQEVDDKIKKFMEGKVK
jgi:arginine repressor